MAEEYPYVSKAIFAFQSLGEQDVCFFGMHVQEYNSDAPAPNTGYVSFIHIYIRAADRLIFSIVTSHMINYFNHSNAFLIASSYYPVNFQNHFKFSSKNCI